MRLKPSGSSLVGVSIPVSRLNASPVKAPPPAPVHHVTDIPAGVEAAASIAQRLHPAALNENDDALRPLEPILKQEMWFWHIAS